jgi:hypothetical protein
MTVEFLDVAMLPPFVEALSTLAPRDLASLAATSSACRAAAWSSVRTVSLRRVDPTALRRAKELAPFLRAARVTRRPLDMRQAAAELEQTACELGVGLVYEDRWPRRSVAFRRRNM